MIKKIVKKIILVLSMTLMLTTANCFASSIIKDEIVNKDNIEYIKRTYSIPTEEENSFLLNLENQFKINKKNYELVDTKKEGGDITETINISTSKTIYSNSNKIDDILSMLEQEIKYDEGGFIGVYKLDIDSLDIKSKYNGYKEYLVEDTKEYIDLDTNDLDNIPKQIMKDGLVLDLITTNWEVTETRNLQDNIIPSKYKAICYYATKKKVDNPLTYIVKADYFGTAEKTTKQDFTYEITYKCVSEDKNIYPTIIIAGGTTLIVCVFLFGRKKNVVIYNYENRRWKEIGKQSIIRPKIKLDRYNYKIKTNRFKIEINEKFINKYNGKMLRIQRKNMTIDKFINKDNNIKPYTIDIVI